MMQVNNRKLCLLVPSLIWVELFPEVGDGMKG
jgi:hypothetical protein